MEPVLKGLGCSCRISGTDIKDKSDLMKARKDVERQMERFKVCEKEMKTKAFSKEGLGQATKLDPREKARNDMRDWINETVDKLTAEVRHSPTCTVLVTPSQHTVAKRKPQ